MDQMRSRLCRRRHLSPCTPQQNRRRTALWCNLPPSPTHRKCLGLTPRQPSRMCRHSRKHHNVDRCRRRPGRSKRRQSCNAMSPGTRSLRRSDRPVLRHSRNESHCCMLWCLGTRPVDLDRWERLHSIRSYRSRRHHHRLRCSRHRRHMHRCDIGSHCRKGSQPCCRNSPPRHHRRWLPDNPVLDLDPVERCRTHHRRHHPLHRQTRRSYTYLRMESHSRLPEHTGHCGKRRQRYRRSRALLFWRKRHCCKRSHQCNRRDDRNSLNSRHRSQICMLARARRPNGPGIPHGTQNQRIPPRLGRACRRHRCTPDHSWVHPQDSRTAWPTRST